MTAPVRLEGGRRRGHTALRALSTVLIVAGALLLLDAAITVVWQEPLSAVYASLRQNALGDDLKRLETRRIARVEVQALKRLRTERRRLTFLARAERGKADPGDPLGRIQIPKLGADFVVVQGTDAGDLRDGPGHYLNTPLPGEPGTVAIAGHRTTYLAPFRDIDDLKQGDPILLRMPYADFTYQVQRTQIVSPDATWVMRRISYDRLVLTACHPLYSAAQRIVVFARLVQSAPRGRARLLVTTGQTSTPAGRRSTSAR
jgi:sortase A